MGITGLLDSIWGSEGRVWLEMLRTARMTMAWMMAARHHLPGR